MHFNCKVFSFLFFFGFVTPILVVGGEAVDHDGYGQGEDEDPGQGAASPDDLAQQSLRVKVITNCGQGHQSPPSEALCIRKHCCNDQTYQNDSINVQLWFP